MAAPQGRYSVFHLAFPIAGFDGLAIEKQVLRKRSLSGSLIPTMLNHPLGKSTIKLGKPLHIVAWIFTFLQRSVEKKHTLSTIKGRVSALAHFLSASLGHVLFDLYLHSKGGDASF